MRDSHPYTREVRRYYEANTSVFRLFEPKGDTIHRAVWAEGVGDRRAAVEYANALVTLQAAGIARRDEPAALRIVDLGCGTGGTFLYLADHLDVPWTGLAVTLSPLQVARANENFRRRGMSDETRAIEADFVHVPSEEPFDLAIAIESFVHCPEPAAFCHEVARLLRGGGRLLVIDDLLSTHAATTLLQPTEAACLREFSRGWLAPAPQSDESLVALAKDAGLDLVSNVDLTPSLHLLPGTRRSTPRALATWILRVGAVDLPIVRSLSGGLALQLALAQGLLKYRAICFERRP